MLKPWCCRLSVGLTTFMVLSGNLGRRSVQDVGCRKTRTVADFYIVCIYTRCLMDLLSRLLAT